MHYGCICTYIKYTFIKARVIESKLRTCEIDEHRSKWHDKKARSNEATYLTGYDCRVELPLGRVLRVRTSGTTCSTTLFLFVSLKRRCARCTLTLDSLCSAICLPRMREFKLFIYASAPRPPRDAPLDDSPTPPLASSSCGRYGGKSTRSNAARSRYRRASVTLRDIYKKTGTRLIKMDFFM